MGANSAFFDLALHEAVHAVEVSFAGEPYQGASLDNGDQMNRKSIYLAKRNPAVSLADWPSIWLSHHQVARQFPALMAQVETVQFCNRVVAPSLDGAPFVAPGASSDYDGVGIFTGRETSQVLTPQEGARIGARLREDELRVFGMNSSDFLFSCAETMVRGGPPAGAAVIRFLVRSSGTTAETFIEQWNGAYAETAARAVEAAGHVQRYVQNVLIAEPPPHYPFAGISETWFASVEDATRAFADPDLAPLARDLRGLCDMDRSITLLTEVILDARPYQYTYDDGGLPN